MIFFMAIIFNNIKYKVQLIYIEHKIDYDIRISTFLNIISIIGKGTNENIEIFIKILFYKKKLKTDFKRDKRNKDKIKYDMGGISFNVADTIKIVHKHKDYLVKFISIIKPKYMKIEGSYGFKDPYITGILSGFVGAISLLLPSHSIKLNPDFLNKVFNLKVKISGKTRIILLIILILKFLVCNACENIIIKLKVKFKRKSKMRKSKFKSADEIK